MESAKLASGAILKAFLHVSCLLGKLQRVGEMHLPVLERNSVDAFACWPGRRAVTLAARFGAAR
jgi:hypothetical protein